jgi:hypothetical protein
VRRTVAGMSHRQPERPGPAPCYFPEPDTFVYLSGVSNACTRAARHPGLGMLAQPRSSVHDHAGDYPFWAADNGCFAEALGKPWDESHWLRWIDEQVVPRRANLLFAVAPDVVGDADATLHRSRPYLDLLRDRGLPAAFVAQNGFDPDTTDWDTFDALFIGGSPECQPCGFIRPAPDRNTTCPGCGRRLTEWKESPQAANASQAARHHGKWVHLGRVNSWRRLDLARRQHADSADGTYLAFGPDKNWPRLRAWIARIADETAAFGVIRDPYDPAFVVVPSALLYGSAPPEKVVAARPPVPRRRRTRSRGLPDFDVSHRAAVDYILGDFRGPVLDDFGPAGPDFDADGLAELERILARYLASARIRHR